MCILGLRSECLTGRQSDGAAFALALTVEKRMGVSRLAQTLAAIAPSLMLAQSRSTCARAWLSVKLRAIAIARARNRRRDTLSRFSPVERLRDGSRKACQPPPLTRRTHCRFHSYSCSLLLDRPFALCRPQRSRRSCRSPCPRASALPSWATPRSPSMFHAASDPSSLVSPARALPTCYPASASSSWPPS